MDSAIQLLNNWALKDSSSLSAAGLRDLYIMLLVEFFYENSTGAKTIRKMLAFNKLCVILNPFQWQTKAKNLAVLEKTKGFNSVNKSECAEDRTVPNDVRA